MDVDRFFKKCSFLSLWDMNASLLPTQVVTCFLQKDDRILVLKRGKKDAQYGLWGIPGGKLNPSESFVTGLCREILEETGILIDESSVSYLGSARSRTLTDGVYGVHLYHALWPQGQDILKLNPNEHLDYKWVSLNEFIRMELLHAQREAFLFVQEKLDEKINQERRLYVVQ